MLCDLDTNGDGVVDFEEFARLFDGRCLKGRGDQLMILERLARQNAVRRGTHKDAMK